MPDTHVSTMEANLEALSQAVRDLSQRQQLFEQSTIEYRNRSEQKFDRIMAMLALLQPGASSPGPSSRSPPPLLPTPTDGRTTLSGTLIATALKPPPVSPLLSGRHFKFDAEDITPTGVGIVVVAEYDVKADSMKLNEFLTHGSLKLNPKKEDAAIMSDDALTEIERFESNDVTDLEDAQESYDSLDHEVGRAVIISKNTQVDSKINGFREASTISEVMKPPPLPPDEKRYGSIMKEEFGARFITLYGNSRIFNCAWKLFVVLSGRQGKFTGLPANELFFECLNSTEFGKFNALLRKLSKKCGGEWDLTTYKVVNTKMIVKFVHRNGNDVVIVLRETYVKHEAMTYGDAVRAAASMIGQMTMWLRKPEVLNKDEYVFFYKGYATDWKDHLDVKHFSMEGQLEFKAILFAENSAHVPVRDSKLTRLLKDSFGGTARTSLVVTIGPSPRHRGETASTILFGQRAMKVENMLKITEEFDYKFLSRKLEMQLDAVITEVERRHLSYNDELERISIAAQNRIAKTERNYSHAFEREKLKYQMEYMDSVKKLEEKLINSQTHGHDASINKPPNGQLNGSAEAVELKRMLQNEGRLRTEAEEEANRLRSQVEQFMQSDDGGVLEIFNLRRMLEEEIEQKRKLEEEVAMLQSQLLQMTFNSDQLRCGGNGDGLPGLDSQMSQFRNSQMNATGNGKKTPMPTLFEQVGLQKILAGLSKVAPGKSVVRLITCAMRLGGYFEMKILRGRVKMRGEILVLNDVCVIFTVYEEGQLWVEVLEPVQFKKPLDDTQIMHSGRKLEDKVVQMNELVFKGFATLEVFMYVENDAFYGMMMLLVASEVHARQIHIWRQMGGDASSIAFHSIRFYKFQGQSADAQLYVKRDLESETMVPLGDDSGESEPISQTDLEDKVSVKRGSNVTVNHEDQLGPRAEPSQDKPRRITKSKKYPEEEFVTDFSSVV